MLFARQGLAPIIQRCTQDRVSFVCSKPLCKVRSIVAVTCIKRKLASSWNRAGDTVGRRIGLLQHCPIKPRDQHFVQPSQYRSKGVDIDSPSGPFALTVRVVSLGADHPALYARQVCFCCSTALCKVHCRSELHKAKGRHRVGNGAGDTIRGFDPPSAAFSHQAPRPTFRAAFTVSREGDRCRFVPWAFSSTCSHGQGWHRSSDHPALYARQSSSFHSAAALASFDCGHIARTQAT